MAGFNRKKLENNAEKANLMTSRLWSIADCSLVQKFDEKVEVCIRNGLNEEQRLNGDSQFPRTSEEIPNYVESHNPEMEEIGSHAKEYYLMSCIANRMTPEDAISDGNFVYNAIHTNRGYMPVLFLKKTEEMKNEFVSKIHKVCAEKLPEFKESVIRAIRENRPENAIGLLQVLSGPVAMLSADPNYKENETVKQLSAMTAACDKFTANANEIRNNPDCDVKIAEKIMLESMERLEQAAGIKDPLPTDQRYLNDENSLKGSFDVLYNTLDQNHKKNWLGKERSQKYQNVMDALSAAKEAEKSGKPVDYTKLSQLCKTYLDKHTPTDKLGEKRYETIQRVMNIADAKQKAMSGRQEKLSTPGKETTGAEGKDSGSGWTVLNYSDLSGMDAEKRAAKEQKENLKREMKQQKKALKQQKKDRKALQSLAIEGAAYEVPGGGYAFDSFSLN